MYSLCIFALVWLVNYLKQHWWRRTGWALCYVSIMFYLHLIQSHSFFSERNVYYNSHDYFSFCAVVGECGTEQVQWLCARVYHCQVIGSSAQVSNITAALCNILSCVFFFLANFFFRLPVSLGGGLSQEQLLESLLSVPVNDALLHLPLSQLPFHSVIVRMKTIGNHFNFYSLFPT